jgi:hypothetical protein
MIQAPMLISFVMITLVLMALVLLYIALSLNTAKVLIFYLSILLKLCVCLDPASSASIVVEP